MMKQLLIVAIALGASNFAHARLGGLIDLNEHSAKEIAASGGLAKEVFEKIKESIDEEKATQANVCFQLGAGVIPMFLAVESRLAPYEKHINSNRASEEQIFAKLKPVLDSQLFMLAYCGVGPYGAVTDSSGISKSRLNKALKESMKTLTSFIDNPGTP